MKLERRAYEDRAVTALREALASKRRVLAVSPTGSGKTVIAALMVAREKRWKRVLFLAHRHELIDQAYATLTSIGIDAGVLMAQDEALHGNERVWPEARVQVASVQTLDKRGVPDGVDLVIVDEAHRALADSYQRVAQRCPKAEVLGLTATPCRLDGKGLGDFFREMLIVAQPSDLYRGGYLAKPETWGAPAGVLLKLSQGLKGVRTHGGDYAVSQLAAAVDRRYLIGEIVASAKKLAPKVPKVVFACSVKHSQNIAAEFRRAGIKAAHLDGDTDALIRTQTLDDLRKGRIEVISNVDVLSEGWDLPALGAVIVARPTKSLARFLQMCGRNQRPYKGKVPIVIDHGANVQRFDIVPGDDIPWSLEKGDGRTPCEGGEPNYKTCVECLLAIPYGCAECPKCGAEQPKTPRQEREEYEADLERITATKMAEMRKRLHELAVKKGAPDGWVERACAR